MRLLLDTHALLWFVRNDPRLTTAAAAAIGEDENEVFVSAASAWEIATKTRLGKLDGGPLATAFSATAKGEGFRVLSITARHAQHAGGMPGPHADPFDRLLMAQALLTGMTLVSNETAFDAYRVPRLW